MESFNDKLKKKISEGKQIDFSEKVYSIAPKRTVDNPQFYTRKQFRQHLDTRKRRPQITSDGGGGGGGGDCFDGAPGQDGAQVNCDGECHAYFA